MRRGTAREGEWRGGGALTGPKSMQRTAVSLAATALRTTAGINGNDRAAADRPAVRIETAVP